MKKWQTFFSAASSVALGVSFWLLSANPSAASGLVKINGQIGPQKLDVSSAHLTVSWTGLAGSSVFAVKIQNDGGASDLCDVSGGGMTTPDDTTDSQPCDLSTATSFRAAVVTQGTGATTYYSNLFTVGLFTISITAPKDDAAVGDPVTFTGDYSMADDLAFEPFVLYQIAPIKADGSSDGGVIAVNTVKITDPFHYRFQVLLPPPPEVYLAKRYIYSVRLVDSSASGWSSFATASFELTASGSAASVTSIPQGTPGGCTSRRDLSFGDILTTSTNFVSQGISDAALFLVIPCDFYGIARDTGLVADMQQIPPFSWIYDGVTILNGAATTTGATTAGFTANLGMLGKISWNAADVASFFPTSAAFILNLLTWMAWLVWLMDIGYLLKQFV